MRSIVLAVALACASCIQVTLRDLHPDVVYDAQGRLAYCGDGSLRVEDRATGKFRAVLGSEWDVREAEPLQDGGWVLASGADAPVHRNLGVFEERTVELWRVTPAGEVERLTDNSAHESRLVALPDGTGVVYRSELAEDGGGLTMAPFVVRRLDWDASGGESNVFDGFPYAVFPAPGGLVVLSYDGEEQALRYDFASRSVEPCAGTEPWQAVDASGRTAALSDFEQRSNRRPKWFVRWRDLATRTDTLLPGSEHVAALAISPDGERIAIVEHDGWSLPLVVVVVRWRSATLREYDRSGALLREIEL